MSIPDEGINKTWSVRAAEYGPFSHKKDWSSNTCQQTRRATSYRVLFMGNVWNKGRKWTGG